MNYLKHMRQVGGNTAFDRRVEYLRYNFKPYLNSLTKGSKVLEIGPGLGELLHIINGKGFTNIDIIDNDKSVLAYCRKTFKLQKTILANNLYLSKLIKGKYNLIVLTQVFEHIPKKSYNNWLRAMYKSLVPGGYILITVPNGANPLVGTERYGDLQHENVFTVFSFRELMTFAALKGSSYLIKGFEIPPSSLTNLIRLVLQKILHSLFILMMIVNGAIYQTLMTPNITLVIRKEK